MVYDKQVLKNGLRLLTIPMPSAASVTMLIMVGVGSRFEEKKINGLSHFLEHMAFKGTQKRPTALDIATTIDGIGGEFNAFTSKDHTGYYIKAASKHLPLLFDVLSDMLLHSKFDPNEIEREKGVIIEEINMYEDMPIRKIGDLYENLLYGDSKLGRDIAGIPDVIRSIAREDFLSYLNRFYSPVNTVATISGGIQGDVKALTEKYLGEWHNKKPDSPDRQKDNQEKPGLLLKHKDTQQAHLCLGVRAFHNTHPDRYKLGVLTNILGGGMSSRLFIEVRERRGLAYYVRSNDEMYTDVGNFVTQAGVDVKRIDDAIKVILQEFDKIREKGVKEKELKKAKENIKGKLILELEDSRNVAGLFASAELLEDRIKTPEEIMRKVDRVTAEDVRATAQNVFKEETLNLAVIGPYKNEERFLKLLKL